VLPFLGAEMIDWLLQWPARPENQLDEGFELPALQPNPDAGDNESQGETMKNGSVQEGISLAPEQGVDGDQTELRRRSQAEFESYLAFADVRDAGEGPDSNDDVLSALTRVKSGNAEEAVAVFADKFSFNDWGIGLEFTDRELLRDFFHKERELYPEPSFQAKTVLLSEDYLIAQWILKYTLREPFWGVVERYVPIALQGVSIVRTSEGKVTEWSDYYDGLTSRRTALSSNFKEWIDY
jgi:hypothetical protein